MTLDLSPLNDAMQQLEKGLDLLDSDLAERNRDIKDQFRTGVVQQFEFVYELCVKFVKRQLGEIAANPEELKGKEFMEIMRDAADEGLVTDASLWRDFRTLRGRTSHTYDKSQAELVIEELDDFMKEARKVLLALEEANRGEA